MKGGGEGASIDFMSLHKRLWSMGIAGNPMPELTFNPMLYLA